ncbi:MAG: hypothetical protein ABW022_11060 [Actinoplanes sp.]
MRALIFQAIIADPTIVGAGIDGDNSFAGDVDTPEYRPFLQLRWGRNDVGLDVVTRRTLNIWVHDEGGDYGRIDAIISRLRALLPTLEGQDNGSGHLMAVEWTGDSEDLTDDGHKTITRFTSFSLVGSGQ